jgi:3-hydroxyisobutyrate dehydrogenase-like beta-hydroxyacid dehydrogenase
MTSTPRQAPSPWRIAVLGLGEAGSAISRDLVAAGADVRGYDPRAPVPGGVESRASEADAVADADLVLCLTCAHEAVAAMRAALPCLRPETIWADMNAAAPQLKVGLTEISAGASVVDVAIMAPVPGKGLHTPMVASGPRAHDVAAHLNSFGGDIDVLDGPVGAASSRKLLRSVFYKGLATSVVEALAGAEAAGCREWLYDNISRELASFDHTTIERLVTGTRDHAKRRTDEMQAAAQQLRDLDVTPRISSAAAELLQAVANEAEASLSMGSNGS